MSNDGSNAFSRMHAEFYAKYYPPAPGSCFGKPRFKTIEDVKRLREQRKKTLHLKVKNA